jgi:transglutaminase-like putative cysteine protease
MAPVKSSRTRDALPLDLAADISEEIRAGGCVADGSSLGYRAAMHFRVTHKTVYRYDAPVMLGTHVLRLSPRTDGVNLHAERLMIEPEPVERSEETDAYVNRVTQVRFSGTTTQLRLASMFELDTYPNPPLAEERDPLPWAAERTSGLDAYRAFSSGPAVRDYAEGVATEAGHLPVVFLDRLAKDLRARTDLKVRPDGRARSAEETLALREGACRDVTVLFLEASRALGLPSRFVSGYQAHAEIADARRHLHAWAEIFLPGTGWRGWDVTHGKRVADGHVALCAAPSQADTMPIEGGFSFIGASGNSTLDYEVHIDAG